MSQPQISLAGVDPIAALRAGAAHERLLNELEWIDNALARAVGRARALGELEPLKPTSRSLIGQLDACRGLITAARDVAMLKQEGP